MHQSVMEWVSQKTQQYNFDGYDILELGSYNVNGSVRPLFKNPKSYVGIDFREGPDVDMVINAHSLTFPPSSFDAVVTMEMLEHDEEFWLTMYEIKRVLRSGGYLLMSARGNGFPLHGFPEDYYRYMPTSFETLMRLAGCSVIEITEDWLPGHPGLFGFGKRQ